MQDKVGKRDLLPEKGKSSLFKRRPRETSSENDCCRGARSGLRREKFNTRRENFRQNGNGMPSGYEKCLGRRGGGAGSNINGEKEVSEGRNGG